MEEELEKGRDELKERWGMEEEVDVEELLMGGGRGFLEGK
jgi:hypothetical protein